MAINNNLETFKRDMWEAAIIEAYKEASIAEMITIAPSSVEGKSAIFHVMNVGGLKDYDGQVDIDEVLAPTAIELVYDQKKYWAIQVDDVNNIQLHADLMLPTANNLGHQIKKAVETAVFEEAAAKAGKKITGKTINTPEEAYDHLVDMAVALDEKNVPAEGRYVVCSPAFIALLQKDSRVLAYSGQAVMPNGIVNMEVAGLQIVKSNNLPEGTAIAIQKDAVVLGVQLEKTEAYRSHDAFADVMRGLCVFGVKAVKEDNIVVLQYTIA